MGNLKAFGMPETSFGPVVQSEAFLAPLRSDPRGDAIKIARRADSDHPRSARVEKKYNSDHNHYSTWARKILLSFDGGGIRGFSSLIILQRLMSIVEELEKGGRGDEYIDYANHKFFSCTESVYCCWHTDEHCRCGCKEGHEDHREASADAFLPHHYFDYIAGTSTGGLSALMLSRLRMSVNSALQQYDEIGDAVFGKPRLFHLRGFLLPKYPSAAMRSALLRVIRKAGVRKASDKIVLRDDHKDVCKTIVMSSGAYRIPRTDGPYMFRSFDHLAPEHDAGSVNLYGEHLNRGEAANVEVWKVARATSAAPRYFSPMSINGFPHKDGGLGTNNPAKRAIEEIRQMHHGMYPYVVVSIGTGLPPEMENRSDTDSDAESEPPRAVRFFRHARELINDVSSLKNIATDSERTHQDIALYFPHVIVHGENPHYFRFNVPGLAELPLDDWQPKKGGAMTKRAILEKTELYLQQGAVQVDLLRCATKLVDLRQQRSETERWEKYTMQFAYRCPQRGCEVIEGLYREDLRKHALEAHHMVDREQLKYVCEEDRCPVAERLWGDENDSMIREHLRAKHGLADARLIDKQQLEAWLDNGRRRVEHLKARPRVRPRDPAPPQSPIEPTASPVIPQNPEVQAESETVLGAQQRPLAMDHPAVQRGLRSGGDARSANPQQRQSAFETHLGVQTPPPTPSRQPSVDEGDGRILMPSPQTADRLSAAA